MTLLEPPHFDGVPRQVRQDDNEIAIWELAEGSDAERTYACIAVCLNDNRNWPAFGGTRIRHSESPAFWEDVRHETITVAKSLERKFRMLRRAAGVSNRTSGLFGFRGGKGLIWTPHDRSAEPRRLLAYGRLLESLQGEFFASIDVNVGNAELRWIEQVTSYTIGNRATRYMSEATAIGIRQGIRSTLIQLDVPAEKLRQPLGNVDVLICGLGKVGFPLLRLLEQGGANVLIYDPSILENDPSGHFELRRRGGAQITSDDLNRLLAADADGRVFQTEESALDWIFIGDDERRPIRILCPATGEVGWLKTRCERLSGGKHDGPKIILGPANNQIDVLDETPDQEVIDALTKADVTLIPDSVVNSGGVISGCHELALEWCEEAVRNDVERVIDNGITMLFNEAGSRHADDVHKAFFRMIQDDGLEAMTSKMSSGMVSA